MMLAHRSAVRATGAALPGAAPAACLIAPVRPSPSAAVVSSSTQHHHVCQQPSFPGTSSCQRRRSGGARRGCAVVVRAAAAPQDPSQALKEMAALDDLIDRLLSTRSQQELARTVAENIFSIDRKFWLRMATRSDTASTKADKERLQFLAEAVMTLVNAMVKRTEEQLEGGGKVLQQVLRAAADDNGEWYLPLAPEQVQRLRDCLDENATRLDEALLSNAFGYIRKCSEDGLDSMAQLIQKVLQLYAARQLRTSASEGIEGHINAVIFAEEKDWAPMLRSLAKSGDITEVTFMEALQKRMEHVVLGLQSGSYAQRVQAEYLKEVEARAKSVFRELAGSQ